MVKCTITNTKQKYDTKAAIVFDGKKTGILKKGKIEEFFQKVSAIKEETKQDEACLVILCLKIGKRIKLESNGTIKLFYDSEQFYCNQPEITITNNKELYSLLKDLVQS